MTYTSQQRAVVQALGLSPDDLRSLAADLARGQTTVTVGEIADGLLDALPEHHRYAKSLRRMIAWAGDADAQAVQPAQIADWAARAADEARADPRARHGVGASEAMVLAARATFAAAIQAGRLASNPASSVLLPERPPSRRSALSTEQLEAVQLTVTARSRDPDLDSLVFQFLRETACRRAGVLGLTRDGIAPITRTVRLVEKYAKQRWVPASAHLVARFADHAQRRHPGCPVVFHHRDGRHLTRKWFESFARRIQHLDWAAELGVTAHWIRHTTLTDIEHVAGIRVAAAYAGHADNTTGITGIYTKPSLDDLHVAHTAVFFNHPALADNPTTPPDLLRRVRARHTTHH